MTDNTAKEWEEALAEGNSTMNQGQIDDIFGTEGSSTSNKSNKTGVQLLLDKSISSHTRLPMLEIVYDRFIRIASSSLRNFISHTVDIDILKMSSLRFNEFIETIPIPSMIGVVKAIEWNNYALIVIESSLIYSFVDILFGGRKTPPSLRVEGRPFTSIEQSIIQNLLELILNDLSMSFDQVTPVTLQLERLESSPRFATISRPDDVAINLELNVNLENREGKINFLLPYSTIEPVKKILSKAFMGERGSKDPFWIKHIEDEIGKATVILECVLHGNTTSVGDAAKLKVGNTIMLDKFANDDVIIRLNNLNVSAGKLGKMNDKLAVQLNKNINGNQEQG
jgi:flagellar motor switch protein FliM